MNYEPVEHSTTDRTLGRLPSGTEIDVTVHRYEGGDGPTVYLQAAQHGIELNGPAALRRLHEHLSDVKLAGTVVSVPLANPPAFDHRSYVTPAAFDTINANMNRAWPGDATGTFQERITARLWDVVSGADAIVDLHTGTPDMLEHVRVTTDDDEAQRLAEVFGTDYRLVDVPSSTPGGKLRAAAGEAGIPAIVAELSNSRRVVEGAVESGVRGLRNVLRELDVVAPEPRPVPEQTVLRDDATPTRAADSGLFELRSDVGVGDRLEAGTELGKLYCPSSFELLETVRVEDSGVAYSLAREAVAVAGERLAAVAPPVE